MNMLMQNKIIIAKEVLEAESTSSSVTDGVGGSFGLTRASLCSAPGFLSLR